MMMGNTDLECGTLLELQRLGFAIEVREEDAEVYISASGLSLQNDALIRALYLIGNTAANECHVVDGRLRLWWD